MSASLPNLNDAANSYFTSRCPEHYLKAWTEDQSTQKLTFELAHIEQGYTCPRCNAYCARFKDADRYILVTDWDIAAGKWVTVKVPSPRLRCRCGCTATVPNPSWVLPGHRVTKRMAGFIQRLLMLRISVSDVERITGISWKLIKEIDKAALKRDFSDIDTSGLRHIAIDEISIHKGHRYAAVIMDLVNKKIIAVLKGKKIADIQPFFDLLKERGHDVGIKSVSVDMNAGFPRLVAQTLPNAKLAYDLFHVMQMLRQNVLAEARKLAVSRARAEVSQLPKKQRTEEALQKRDTQLKLLREADWLVIMEPSLLHASRTEQLNQLREHNALFRDLYMLPSLIRSIWQADSDDEARQLLHEAIETCEAIGEEHDFKEIRVFARMLKRRAEGIVNACVVGLGTNILEGANNTAKVIKRIAYGFKDFEYFALKLKSAFPGKHFSQEARLKQWVLRWQDQTESLCLNGSVQAKSVGVG